MLSVSSLEFRPGNCHEFWTWEIMGSAFYLFTRFTTCRDKEYLKVEFLE